MMIRVSVCVLSPLGALHVQVAQRAPPQGRGIDGQHVGVCQLIVHKVQPQMRIHSFCQVLHSAMDVSQQLTKKENIHLVC